MNVSHSIENSFSKSLASIKRKQGVQYMLILILALIAFEAFNFSTTEFALSDLLGAFTFLGVRWATLLAVAFCGIDFAGIARLFTPQTDQDEPRKVWFLFGTWIMAATMNALLTWWGVVLAISNHSAVSTSVVDAGLVTHAVPILIALMVWVVRILLIGTLSKKGDQVLHTTNGSAQPTSHMLSRRELRQAQSRAAHQEQNKPTPTLSFSRPAKAEKSTRRDYKPEPTYIPMAEDSVYQSFKSTKPGGRRL